MGGSQSHEQNLLQAYYNHMKKQSGAVVGGSDAVLGGYSALQDYGNSVYSKAKEELIRGIAKDVGGILGLKDANGSLENIIKRFKEVLPKPGTGKGSLKADAGKHAKLCALLAKAINKRYDMELIDESAEPHVVCQRVAELMYSLFTGLHSEFLNIAGDVSRIVKNLEILQGIVDAANQKVMNDLAKSGEESISADADSTKQLYSKISDEIRRQHVMLSNIINSSIGPVGSSLITLLADNQDFTGLIEDMKQTTGTQYFGDKLAHLLAGISDVAHSAHLVDKALKTIGMSVADYKNVHGLKDLRSKVYSTISKKKPSSDQLHKLLVAADILYRNDLAHDDIAAHLSKKGGELEEELNVSGGDFADMLSDSTWSDTGKGDSPFVGRPQLYRKSIDKQLHEQERYRKMLLQDLNNQLRDKNQIITDALHRMAKKVGTEIALTPALDIFVRNLNAFKDQQPDRENLHIALSGYKKSIQSDYVRNRYMDSLYVLLECLSDLIKERANPVFGEIKNAIEDLIKVVDNFNLNFTKVISEPHIKIEAPHPHSARGGEDGGEDADGLGTHDGGKKKHKKHHDEQKSDSETEEVNAEVVEVEAVAEADADAEVLGGLIGGAQLDMSHFVTLAKVINEVDYNYRIAGIKSNMNNAAESYQNNVENYENILGEEAGLLIDRIQQQYNNLILGTLETLPTPNTWNGEDVYVKRLFNGEEAGISANYKESLYKNLQEADDKLLDTTKEQLDGYKFLLEYQRSAQVEMIEAAQALDLYLSKFTHEIQLKPDQIKDFIKIIEQLEVVARWFTDKSGDKLVEVFECFANEDNKIHVNLDSNDLPPPIMEEGQHYYNYLSNNSLKPGQLTPRLMKKKEAINFVKLLEKSIKGVRALENVINIFTRINVNNSDTIHTFMSPAMMFKAFMKYCVASAFGIGEVDVSNDGKLNASDILKAKMAVGLRLNDHIVGNKALLNPLATNKINQVCPVERLFEMSIKSMVSKIFVIVGSYSLFNRPAKLNRTENTYSNSALRQIMGGLSDTPQIRPECVELYLRLPLLVEWYRKVFNFAGKEADMAGDPPVYQKNDNDLVFSAVPEMDGVWGPLYKAICGADGANIENGAYPSYVTNAIYKAINDIHAHYKGKSCRDIVQEFVKEINNRYGLMKRKEIATYLDNRESDLKDSTLYDTLAEDRVDFDLLDAENEMGRKSAPSDRFRKTYLRADQIAETKMIEFDKAVRNYLNAIEANLMFDNKNDLPGEDGKNLARASNVSLSEMIHNIQKRVSEASDNKERYRIVHAASYGIDKYGGLDKHKLLLFHETVIAPLSVLYFVYLILNDFNKVMISLNPVDSKIDDKSLKENNDKFKIDQDRWGSWHNKNAINDEDKEAIWGKSKIVGLKDDKQKIMKLILRKAMMVGCDLNGLAEISFMGSGDNRFFSINFDGLERLCSDLFNDVRTALRGFKKSIPSNIWQPYEELEVAKDKLKEVNRISLYWIKDNLFERLFNNKYKNGLPDGNAAMGNIFTMLVNDKNTDKTTLSYNEAISELAFWVANDGLRSEFTPRYLTKHSRDAQSFPAKYVRMFNSGGNLASPKTDVDKLYASIILSNSDKFDDKKNIPINKGIATISASKKKSGRLVILKDLNDASAESFMLSLGFKNIYDYNLAKPNNDLGLLVRINHLIYSYVNIFIDPSTGKIYKPLIEKFINGYNSKDILQGKNINDNVRDYKYQSMLLATEPQQNAVLFASLANGLDGLYNTIVEKITSNLPLFLEDNLANVNEYQKELMRAYLPLFEKELNLMLAKCEFLKRVLEQTSCKVEKKAIAVGNIIIGNKENEFDSRYTQSNKIPDTDETEPQRKGYLLGMLNDIINTANSLQKCIVGVQKELADVPLYMEQYKGSLTDYNNRNGHLPLIPLSSLTHLMNIRLFKTTLKTDEAIDVVVEDGDKKLGGDGEEKGEEKGDFSSTDLEKAEAAYKIALFYYDAKKIQIDRQMKEISKYSPSNPIAHKLYEYVKTDQSELADLLVRLNEAKKTFEEKGGKLDVLKPTPLLASSGDYNLMLVPIPGNIGVGSSSFKWLYATRGILNPNQKVSVDYMPGVLDVVDKFNTISGGAEFNKSAMSNIVKGIVPLARYVLDYMYLHQILDQQKYGDVESLIDNNTKNLACQTGMNQEYGADGFWTNTENVLGLSDNNNVAEAVSRLMKCISHDENKPNVPDDRDKMRIYNVLDLNIVPINVHAMQREIPFVNLMNYSYTFDKLCKELIGDKYKNEKMWKMSPKVGSVELHPEDTLVRHMIWPMGDRENDNNNTVKLMAGNTSLALGRPKFLSDQLWNKVLLNSLFAPSGDLNNMDKNLSRVISTNSSPDLSNVLSYVMKGEIKTVDFTGVADKIHTISKKRYGTRLIRNVEWFANIQRLITILMRRQLEWVQDPVVQKHDALSEQLTEFKDNNTFNQEDFF